MAIQVGFHLAFRKEFDMTPGDFRSRRASRTRLVLQQVRDDG
ncbi:hypothetical protein [Streptomyces swartbergensis]|nr:hypothetical protein [Streptomyces swartbergensis]